MQSNKQSRGREFAKQIRDKYGPNAYVERKQWQMPEAEAHCTQYYVMEAKMPHPVIRKVANKAEELLKD